VQPDTAIVCCSHSDVCFERKKTHCQSTTLASIGKILSTQPSNKSEFKRTLLSAHTPRISGLEAHFPVCKT
jgi:hypothetical protein